MDVVLKAQLVLVFDEDWFVVLEAELEGLLGLAVGGELVEAGGV